MAKQARSFAFTFYYTDPPVFDPEHMQFLVYGKEICPDTGRDHWQCHVDFKKKKTYSGVRKFFPYLATDALSVVRDYDNHVNYCRKDGKATEFGTPFAPGTRNDLITVKNRLLAGELFSDLLLDDSCAEIIARHMPYFRTISTTVSSGAGLSALQAQLSGATLRAWQQDLITDVIGTPPSPRHVHWYYEELGLAGKTFMANYLTAFHNTIVFTGGKVADISYAYNNQPVVIFDIARSNAECMIAIYQCIEMFKNRRLFSAKYESHTKLFTVPHVLCFANFEPDKTKLSADRWKVHHVLTV